MPNRLAGETSPYLLQHKDNPVDWYPWDEEALAAARADDRPIFLSIGYSACHWCHVMAHESFEDPYAARLLNENFISIKVDREERPDIDSIYMSAVQAVSGSGGWPMSVFLLPDGRPFFGGTYYPKNPRHGLQSFTQLLVQIIGAYREHRDSLLRDASSLTTAINRALNLQDISPTGFAEENLQVAFQEVASRYDKREGGFSSQPKFPPSMTLEFLLRLNHRYGWKHALDMVIHTLDRMAWGGMADQIGGGFHRYSTDSKWLIPHFEKMLYDNALLARIYLNAYKVTGELRYRRVVDETLEYVRREMTDPAGGFYSSQDADSEGHEGRFFVWDSKELAKALNGFVNVDVVMDYWGVNAGPNFEGGNILWVPDPPENVAKRHRLSVGKLLGEVGNAREILFQLREQRVKPGTDTKILTAWNGLMIMTLAEAARALDRPDYLDMAAKAADFILGKMRIDGKLRRSFRDSCARFNGYLEDYAFLAEGLIELYQTTFDLQWFKEALAVTEKMVQLFWDDEAGFYDTASDHESLIARPQEITDSATQSGTSSATATLLRMAILADRPDWRERAERILGRLATAVQGYPLAFSYLACQMDFALSQPHEIVLVGELASDPMRQMLDVVFKEYRPNQIAALKEDSTHADVLIPLLRERKLIDGRPTAYVCRNFVCRLPVNTPDDLARELTRQALKPD